MVSAITCGKGRSGYMNPGRWIVSTSSPSPEQALPKPPGLELQGSFIRRLEFGTRFLIGIAAHVVVQFPGQPTARS